MYLAGTPYHIFNMLYQSRCHFHLTCMFKKLLNSIVRIVFDECGVMYRKDSLMGRLRCPKPYIRMLQLFEDLYWILFKEECYFVSVFFIFISCLLPYFSFWWVASAIQVNLCNKYTHFSKMVLIKIFNLSLFKAFYAFISESYLSTIIV